MAEKFKENLARLANSSVHVADSGRYWEHGAASVALTFSNGTKLRADYWRIFKKDLRPRLSSFDHRQKYGLPAPIDAITGLQKALGNAKVVEATLDSESADLIFIFDNDYNLQILTVTCYEIWEIDFPDGTGEYSNYL